MDIVAINDFLANYSDWSNNILIDKVKLSIDNSLNFGQIGYARVISDFSTIAQLGDVYVLENYREKGLSNKLMDEVMYHPNLQGLRRWILTSTAAWLYKKYNFTSLVKPEIYMEFYNPNIYKKDQTSYI